MPAISATPRNPDLLASGAKRSAFEVAKQGVDPKAGEREQMLHLIAEDIAEGQWRTNGPHDLPGCGIDLLEQKCTVDHLPLKIIGELFFDGDSIAGSWMLELSASACRHRPFARGKVLDLRVKDVEDQPPVVGQMLSHSSQCLQLIVDIEIMQECPIWNCDKRERAMHSETPHIAFDELHTPLYMRRSLLKLIASNRQHVVRGVEADDFDFSLGRRDEYPACAAAQLENRRSCPSPKPRPPGNSLISRL
jgi:hypothetical protein